MAVDTDGWLKIELLSTSVEMLSTLWIIFPKTSLKCVTPPSKVAVGVGVGMYAEAWFKDIIPTNGIHQCCYDSCCTRDERPKS